MFWSAALYLFSFIPWDLKAKDSIAPLNHTHEESDQNAADCCEWGETWSLDLSFFGKWKMQEFSPGISEHGSEPIHG